MHRVLLIRPRPDSPEKFVVVGDSTRPEASETQPLTLQDVGASPWKQLHSTPGYDAPSSTLECAGRLSGLSYWYVNKTGVHMDYDFAAAGISERKVVITGELHVEHDGRRYVALPGDTMLYLTDPGHVDDSGAVLPFPVRFLADHACTVVYADFAVVEDAVPARGFK